MGSSTGAAGEVPWAASEDRLVVPCGCFSVQQDGSW